jgi:RNA polymerase sigma factor (sigma-70 family)
LTTNLALIERAVAFACRRYRLDSDDAEELASVVKLRLIENEYAILRAYEARSSFATYISIVVQRMALDFRIHQWGKWHSSAEAKRLGALAIDLERLLLRDGRTLDDAVKILASRHEGVTPQSIAQLANRLPERPPRHRDVPLDDEAESITGSAIADVEEKAIADDRRRTSEQLSALVSTIVGRLPDDDRLIFQLRFEGGMSVAQIARSLQIEQKLLYRRIERRMLEIREELERSGIAPSEAIDLIGRDDAVLTFDLGKRNPRPSIPHDERATAQSEGSQ